MTDLSGGWLAFIGGLALVSLVPIAWAIVDVVRRPPWQFSSGRKALWVITLGIGWLLVWPLALVAALLYLAVLRRRLPPNTARQVPPPRQAPPPPPPLPPAGWYPDPAGGPGQRWWDGVGWTNYVR